MKRKFINGNKKINIYLLIFLVSFLGMIMFVKSNLIFENDTFLGNLISESTNNSNSIFLSIKDKLTSPKYILYNGLNKIVEKESLSAFSTIDIDDFNYESSKSEYVDDPNPIIISEPIVYLYNTHQLEEYNLESFYDYSIKPNVLIASYILREKLNNKGINTIVETNNMKEYLNNNNLSYNMSYHASEYFARLAQRENPTIKYLIDIHRDSAKYSTTFIEIDGISYARVMYVIGLEHTTMENNTGFAESLNQITEELYPGLSRGVLNKIGPAVNGIYNQNLDGKSVLIEVGGVDNKLEEVNNTMEALSVILQKYIEGEL